MNPSDRTNQITYFEQFRRFIFMSIHSTVGLINVCCDQTAFHLFPAAANFTDGPIHWLLMSDFILDHVKLTHKWHEVKWAQLIKHAWLSEDSKLILKISCSQMETQVKLIRIGHIQLLSCVHNFTSIALKIISNGSVDPWTFIAIWQKICEYKWKFNLNINFEKKHN